MARTVSTKGILEWAIKIAVFVVAWGYVVYKFQTMDGDIALVFSDEHFALPVFLLVCLLMLCNWGLETLKWQKLVACSQEISYTKALSGVLVGLPLALITPNRIGEIGGRAIVLDRGRKNAVFATFLGSLMQLSTTLLMGLLGIAGYLLFLPHNPVLGQTVLLSLGLLCFVALLVLFCKKQRWLKLLFLKAVGRKFFVSLLNVVRVYSRRDIARALLLSMARYAVFGSQFAMLVKMLVPELSAVEIFVGITLMYLFTTLIPTSVLGEIGIRGSVAMAIFQFYTENVAIIFQISIIIWIVNIVAPTLTGSVILMRRNRERKPRE